MANETITNIAHDIKFIDQQIISAKDMIRFMKNAGQDTVNQESKLRSAIAQADKWRDALKLEGIEIPKPY